MMHSTSSTHYHATKKKRGFTLMELMIVIAIIGIIRAIAIPRFGVWEKNAIFRGAVAKIRAEMLHTKMIAFETGHEVRMELCEDVTNSYQIIEGDMTKSSSFDLHNDACPMSPESQTNYRDVSRRVRVGDLTDYPGVTLSDTTGNTNPFIKFSPVGTANSFRTFRVTDGMKTQDFVVSMVGRIRLK